MQTGRISQSDDFTITNDVDFCYSDNNRNVFVPPENAQYIDRGGAAIAIKWGDILSTNTETVHFEYNECRDSDSKTCLGGGAILAYIADINIDNCNFSHNHSDSNGGAIAIVDSDEDNGCEGSIIANAEFNGNSAKKYGGAIYFSGNSTLTIDGCSFLTASDSIYLDGCEVTLNLKNSITLVASIATGSEKNSNTKLLDGATITFTNTEAIEIVHLTISANNVNNTFTFNTYNGSNTISFDDQDLSKVTFGAYIHSGTDSQHVIATGVTAIKEEYKAATPVNVVNDEYRQIKFYHLDSNKVLTHNLTDTLTVVIDGKGNTVTRGAGEFASEEALFAWAGDNFIGTINREVAKGYKYEHSLIGTKEYKDNGIALTVKGTITGSAIAVLANGKKIDNEIASTSINVTGTVEEYVIGGAYARNGEANVTSTEVVLAGTLKQDVFGGSWVSGTAEADAQSECTDVHVEINAGATQEGGYVLGGGMASGHDVKSNVINTSIVVNADFESKILAGGFSQLEGKAKVENATIDIKDGTTSTVFAGGTNDSGSTSMVTGTVEINLDGGTVNDIYLNGKYSGSVVEGDVTLNVKQNAVVNKIDGLTSTGTVTSADTNTTINVAATLTVKKISFVDNWNIKDGGAIAFSDSDFLDFEQKIQNKIAFGPINLSIDDDTVGTEGRDVLTTVGGIENFNNSFVNVTLNNEVAAYENGVFASANYTLTLVDGNKLVFAAAQLA